MVDLPRDVIDTLIAEAYAEGPEGMRRVAETIINRAAIRGLTPEQVVRQAHQYTGYEHPGSDAKKAQRSDKARTAAEAAWNLALQPGDPTGGADHYLNPSVANPSWASKLPSTGTYGNHKFFASRPIPPGEIANVVGTLTDTVPPRAVAPATISPTLAALRDMTSPLGDNTGLPDVLQRYATRQANQVTPAIRRPSLPSMGTPDVGALYSGIYPAPQRQPATRDANLSDPGAVDAVIRATQGGSSDNALQRALTARMSAPPPLPTLTVGGRQPIGMVQPGNIDLNSRKVLTDGVGGYRTENSMSIGTDRGEVLIPTVVNGKQLSEQGAIEHFQRTGENLGTFQTPQAADRYAETLHERQGQHYAGLVPKAVPQSQIDRTASRTPPSLPRPRPQTAPSFLVETSFRRVASSNPTKLPPIPSRVAAAQSQIERGTPRVAAAPRPRVTVSTPYTTPQSSIERGAPRVASAIGQPPATRVVQSVPMPAIRPTIPQSFAGMEGGYRAPTPIPDRLAASDPLPPALYGGVTGVVSPPTPRPRIARVPTPAPPYRAVADQLDVAPMPELPRPRPDLGIGGVDIAAPISQTGQVAPVPMPRLERGGIFGKPQIFGHDVPLPGIFGMIQNVTKAMNNASGPFNNGADNWAYDTMRGGDFNAPGAATAQAGGFRYAPRPGGGWINVGRINPAQSGADLYDSRNRRNEVADDAANRVNGRGGSSGASSIGTTGSTRNKFAY